MELECNETQLEFDDGNGMWISSGVSCDLSTCLRHGVSRRTTSEKILTLDTTPLFSRLIFRTSPSTTRDLLASARVSEALTMSRRDYRALLAVSRYVYAQ